MQDRAHGRPRSEGRRRPSPPLTRLLVLIAWTLLALARPAFAQDTGVLQVESNARGAVVWIDYQEVGQVPLTRYLPPGAYTVRVAADGFDPWVRRVSITPGLTQAVSANLVKGGGTVEFNVLPAGASVQIDGRDVGVTPIRLSDLPPGTHAFRLSKAGHEPVEGTFNLAEGGNPLIFRELESSAGRWTIASKPEGARVFLDGEEVGLTPLELRDVPSGEHVVNLLLPGYALVTRQVDTSGGQRGEVDATLSPDGARIIVKTGSPEGRVTVNGVEVGTGRKVSVLMTRGEVDLGVASGGEPAHARVEVPLAGTLIYRLDADRQGGATLSAQPPAHQRWTFWAAVGAGAAGLGAGSALAAIALAPEPPASGDIVITLP